MRIKSILAAALCSLLLVAGVGCKGPGNGTSAETLVFWCNSGYLIDFETRLAEFTRQTGIPVRVEGIQANSWGELAQSLASSAYAGDLPDCGDLASEAMATLVEAGLIDDIDADLARDAAELAPSIAQMHPKLYNAHKYNGKMYSLPTIFNNMCLYYNKNVLKEAGIKPGDPDWPHEGWTIEQFLSACYKVTAKNTVGGTQNKYGYKLQNQYFLTIEPWLNAFGVSVLNADWTASQVAAPAAKEAWAFLYDLMNNPDVAKQVSPTFGGTAEYDLFYGNRLAFMANGLPYVEFLKTGGFNDSKNNPSKLLEGYDVVSFPTVDGVARSTIGVGACPIFKSSKNKENAWKLAKFLSSKQFQEDFLSENLWAIPVVRSAADKMAERDFFPENGAIFYNAIENGVLVPSPPSYSAIELEVRKTFGGYIAGATGFKDLSCFDTLSAAINRLL
jgi:ABC-type glycerol-3-phosphate transport system substrate-binding protein